jgi:hypothetical protein
VRDDLLAAGCAMSRTEEILEDIANEIAEDKASRMGAPMAFLRRRSDGLLALNEQAIIDVALESAANNAVLRRRVAELTAQVEVLSALVERLRKALAAEVI